MLLLAFAGLLIHPALGAFEQLKMADQACPSPWLDGTLLDLGCLLFNSSKFYTWEEASVYCQGEENATLVEIWTDTQLDFIRMELRLLGEVEGAKNWWTAGTDVGREGKWSWAPSGAAVGDFIWSASNPNGGVTHNCLDLCYSCDGTDYKGSDTACSSQLLPLCQKK